MDLHEAVSAGSVKTDKCFVYSANGGSKFRRKLPIVRHFLKCFKFGVRP